MHLIMLKLQYEFNNVKQITNFETFNEYYKTIKLKILF